MGGYFFFGGMVMRFTKPPMTYQEQIELLVSRGMLIDNYSRARHYLSHLNYYRLAAYWLPFEQDHATHNFKPGTTFDKVIEHYIFDRELRLLVSAWVISSATIPASGKDSWVSRKTGGSCRSGGGMYKVSGLSRK